MFQNRSGNEAPSRLPPDRSAQVWDSHRGEVARSLLTSGCALRVQRLSRHHDQGYPPPWGCRPVVSSSLPSRNTCFEIIRTGHMKSLEP